MSGGGSPFDLEAKREELKKRAAGFRLDPTPAEAEALRVFAGEFGRESFAFQRIIGFYIVDFLFREEKVVVEIDGGSHEPIDARLHDAERRGYLRGRSYHVVNVPNVEIFERPERVVHVIRALRHARSEPRAQTWSWFTQL